MKPGELRKWNKVMNERAFLVLKVLGGRNGFCVILDDGRTVTRSCLDVLSNSDVLDEAG